MGCRASGYTVMDCRSSSARRWVAFGVVTIWKLGVSGSAPCVRQVLRTTQASSSSRVRKLWAGLPSSRRWVEALRSAAAERWAGATASRVVLGIEILVGEEQWAPRLAHVPLGVVGERAQEDVCPHPILQPVVDRADLQIDRFHGAKRPLHLGEPLVAAHHFGGVHSLRGKRCANDIQPVEGGFRRHRFLEQPVVEALLPRS